MCIMQHLSSYLSLSPPQLTSLRRWQAVAVAWVDSVALAQVWATLWMTASHSHRSAAPTDPQRSKQGGPQATRTRERAPVLLQYPAPHTHWHCWYCQSPTCSYLYCCASPADVIDSCAEVITLRADEVITLCADVMVLRVGVIVVSSLDVITLWICVSCSYYVMALHADVITSRGAGTMMSSVDVLMSQLPVLRTFGAAAG